MSENNSLLFATHKSFNVHQLSLELIAKWKVILITILVVVITAVAYTAIFIKPKYSSTAKILIIKTDETVSASDMEITESSYLTNDIEFIITDKRILNIVAERLDNKYSSSQLKSFITIEKPTGTRVIEVMASTPNPKDSKKIVDTVCDVVEEEMEKILGIDRVNPISYGDIAARPSSPNLNNVALFSLLLGLLAGVAIVLFMYTTNNKISSPEDIEKQLGMSVLATIPFNDKKRVAKNK